MIKTLIGLVLLLPIAYADKMPESSKQYQALHSIVTGVALGGMGGAMVECPPRLDIPNVQIGCAAVFDSPLSVPGEFDKKIFDQDVPLNAIGDGWTYYPSDESFQRTYTFPDGSEFRVTYDTRKGVGINIVVLYIP